MTNNLIEILEKRLGFYERMLPKENDGSLMSEYEFEELRGRIGELKGVIEIAKLFIENEE